nr:MULTISPECIES: class I SAM-dependent methyltransferase [unclassified Bradyrhizobium]
MRHHGVASGKLLDLGCGTGMHAIELARRGWSTAGIDLSPEMIAQATSRAEQAGFAIPFRQGDACEAGAERDFDTVVSLFHVASYQKDRERLEGFFRTAYSALRPGGIFLFDYWYGGAVLAQGVETRVKVKERTPLRVTRIAQSDHDELNATVSVNYTLFCEDTDQSLIRRVDETHRIRYWFPFEIENSLRACNFEAVGSYAWLSEESPNSKTWAAYSVARKSPKE